MKKNCFCLALLLFILVFSLPSFGESQGTETTWSCEPISIGINNSAALQGYIDKAFGIRHGIEITPRNATLTGINKTIYEQLVPLIQDIASGGRSSTVLEITVNGDLSEFNLGAVLHALLVNHPYDLYWFDKTQQTGCSYGSGHMTFSMKVASEYSVSKTTGTTEFDNTIPADISYAAARAHSILSDNAGKNDYQKLLAYKDAICALVSYNDEAAGDNAHDYGNPWQLIWVFDDNPETNVVCEGYSKAFKYLCDLSQFRNSVSTSIVNGSMTGATGAGRHMWNLVNIGDGKNYLSDITNCDEGTVGSPDLLFMAGYSSLYDNNGTSGYIFTANDSQIIYVYDSDIVDLYSAEELAVANGAYTVPADPQIVASGDCGANLTWTLDNEGWLNISGSGEMNHYGQDETGSEQSPWFSHALEIQHVTLSSDVSTIGSYAFDSCQQLTTISLPKNLYDIGSNAFSGCNNLSDIFFGGTETRWQLLNKAENNEPLSTAHLHCSGQSTVWLSGTCGDHLTFTASDDGTLIIRGTGEMYDYSYDENNRGTAPWYDLHKEIYRVILQPGVTSIGSFAFADCFGLSIVSLPEGLLSIGNSAFYFCNLRNFVLPISLTSIGTDVFSRCDLTEIQYAGTSADWLNVSGCNQEDFQNISLHCSDSVLIAYGTCGDNLSWTLDDTGLLNIRGSGEMTHYETVDPVNNIVNSPWFSHIKTITSVSIGENVTSIGIGAFSFAVNLNSITIPASVTNIAPWAFNGCSCLSEILVESGNSIFFSVDGVLYTKDMTSLICYPAGKAGASYNIPDSVTVISASAFWGCESLTSINIPNGVTSIEDQAFSRCGVLQLDIPDSVTSIGTYAFSVCNSLTSVRLPARLTELAEAIFAWSPNLSEITIPENVTSIGANAFSGTKIAAISIPDGVTSIGDFAFQWCSSLSSITLPKTLTFIGKNAFEGTALKSITVPENVKFIDDAAFHWCFLNTVYYLGPEEDWDQISIGDDNDSLRSATIVYAASQYPESAHPYENNADDVQFYSHPDAADYLKITFSADTETEASYDYIYIEDSVNTWQFTGTELAGKTIYLKGSTFCITLSSNGSVPAYGYTIESITAASKDEYEMTFFSVSSDGVLTGYSGSGGDVVIPSVINDQLVTAIGESAFWGYNITSIIIPNSVTSIGYAAFSECTVLTNVVIPNTVTSIGGGAFQNCTSLTSITIPNSVSTIGAYAFYGCFSLTDITIPDSVTSIGVGPFSFCTSLTNITVSNNNPCYCSVDGILLNKARTNLINYPIGNTDSEYVIPQGVTSIDTRAFAGSTRQFSITIPDSVTSIGEGAFECCRGLTSITIPGSVTNIYGAFGGCSGLTSITLMNGITSIDGAFGGCSSLTSITIPDSVTSIDGAFSGCSSLTSITIPDSITNIGYGTFQYCTSLTSITIPNSVTSIDSLAFDGCSALTSVFFSGTVQDWTSIAFGDSNDPLLNAGIHFLPVPNLVLPSELTEIESEAFAGLPQNSIVYVPDSVTSIAEDAFDEGTIIVTPEGSPAAEWADTNGFECYEQ